MYNATNHACVKVALKEWDRPKDFNVTEKGN